MDMQDIQADIKTPGIRHLMDMDTTLGMVMGTASTVNMSAILDLKMISKAVTLRMRFLQLMLTEI